MTEARAVEALARRLLEAENAGDAAFIAGALSDDAVIVPPGHPPVEGREACAAFVQGTLADVRREFESVVVAEAAEVRVSGDLAFDRGSFVHTLVRLEDGERSEETGRYLRIYTRSPEGEWRLARVLWNQWTPEPEQPGGEPASPDRGTPAAGDGF